jgi:hypothetical protein
MPDDIKKKDGGLSLAEEPAAPSAAYYIIPNVRGSQIEISGT